MVVGTCSETSRSVRIGGRATVTCLFPATWQSILKRKSYRAEGVKQENMGQGVELHLCGSMFHAPRDRFHATRWETPREGKAD